VGRFYNGQPVICVDGRLRRGPTQRYPGLIWPKKGRKYIIRCAEVPQRGARNFVLVQEIRNRIITWPCGARFEAGFWEDRFEPATDITLLEDIKDFAGLQAERHRERAPKPVVVDVTPYRRRREKA
jgi:hypothetical protein